MLEGWDPDGILIEALEFLDVDSQIIQPSISSVSILLDRARRTDLSFSIALLLAEGENEISVVGAPLSSRNEEQYVKAIVVRYLADLQSDISDESPIRPKRWSWSKCLGSG